MTDEQKRVVAELRKHGLNNGSMGYHSGWMDEAADMIEQQAAENDALRAENVQIRQTSVAHSVYKAVLDELEQVKRERDVLEYDRDALNAELIQARKERDAAVKIIRDARVYLEELGSPQYCLYQLMKWPCAGNS